MNITARSFFSATTAIGLTAFATLSAFTASASASVTAMALGLLAIYGLVELMILSYSTRRLVRRATSLRVVAVASTSVDGPTMAEFPTDNSRSRAA